MELGPLYPANSISVNNLSAFSRSYAELSARLHSGERGDSLSRLFGRLQNLTWQVPAQYFILCRARISELHDLHGIPAVQHVAMTVIRTFHIELSVGLDEILLLSPPPTRDERFFELSQTITHLYGENTPFNNCLSLLDLRFRGASENDLFRLNQFLSHVFTVQDFELYRDEVLAFVTSFLQGLVESEPFFTQAMSVLRVLVCRPGNMTAYGMWLLKELHDSWIVMPAKGISPIKLGKLLIGYERMRKVRNWWQERRGKATELVPFLLRLKEPLDLPLSIRSLFPLSREREDVVAAAAAECLPEVLDQTSRVEDLHSLLMSIAIWQLKLDQTFARELAAAPSPEDSQTIRALKTNEVLAQLGFSSETLRLFVNLDLVANSLFLEVDFAPIQMHGLTAGSSLSF